jgi:transcriptional regulator with XRE-family HTH domain
MAKKKTLGAVLRDARLAKGLTLQTVGEAIGVSGSAISHWEAGTNGLREDNLKAICRTLKLPIRSTLELAGL